MKKITLYQIRPEGQAKVFLMYYYEEVLLGDETYIFQKPLKGFRDPEVRARGPHMP